jgi:tRNA (mo5U34)-methyltransferase
VLDRFWPRIDARIAAQIAEAIPALPIDELQELRRQLPVLLAAVSTQNAAVRRAANDLRDATSRTVEPTDGRPTAPVVEEPNDADQPANVPDGSRGSTLQLPPEVDPELLRKLALGREWFHKMDLGYGVHTPGLDDSAHKLNYLGIPEDLTGRTVLDIGAYDGFFSFEAERRGAARVVAADKFCWSIPGGMCDGAGFDIAHWTFQSGVEKRVVSVEEISPETVGTFDLVLFLGVLYHAPDPLRYLRNAFSVCDDLAIIETHIDGQDYPRPMMVFYPGDTLDGDPSNWWGPNEACVVAMLEEVGFRSIEKVSERGRRMVFHARR